MNARLKLIHAELKKGSLDGLIASSPYNISYLTKYRSRDSYLLITKNKGIYFTDSRYIEEAKEYLKGVSIKKITDTFPKALAQACVNLKLKRIGFEAANVTFAQYKKIKAANKKLNLIPAFGLVESLRQVKDNEELKKIKKAVDIAIKAFAFAKKIIAAGKKEIEIAAELERFIRYNGAFASSFNIIVASGPNSSYPHYMTALRKIKNNEPVLVDLGVDYQGYKSDLTRVFFLGKINAIIRTAYDIVLKAQEKAIKIIRPGENVSNVDNAARQYITQKGYGGFFGHSLGHGVGLEVHEAPSISQKENNEAPRAKAHSLLERNTERPLFIRAMNGAVFWPRTYKLKEGMVFTIEPGIYLAGKFGIRIEDMVLVTKKGCDIISGSLNK